MDTNTMFVAALILHFSLCVASKGQFDGIQDMILSGSVFQIFRRTTLQQCRRLCGYSSRCLSVNWSSLAKECQLNAKTGNMESLQVSDKNIYLPVQQMTRQTHPCADAPCGDDHVCVPITKSTNHVCVHVDTHTIQSTSTNPTGAATTVLDTTTPAPTSTLTQTITPTLTTTTQTTTPEPTTTPAPTTSTPAPTTSTSAPTTTTPAPTTTTPAPTTTTTAPTTTSAPTTTTPTPTTSTLAPTTTTPAPTTTTPAPTTTTPTTTTPPSTTTPTSTTPVPKTTPAPTSTTTVPTTTTPTTTTHDGTCVDNSDCSFLPFTECSNSLCVCTAGSDMDDATGMCRSLAECTSFGSTFTTFTDTAILENNLETHTSMTSAQCEQLCLDASFVCKSFEIYYSYCLLQKVSWYDVTESERGYKKNAYHSQRRCNW